MVLQGSPGSICFRTCQGKVLNIYHPKKVKIELNLSPTKESDPKHYEIAFTCQPEKHESRDRFRAE